MASRSLGITAASWNNMLNRCYRATDPSYERYGGRGIRVCDRWRGDEGYQNFLEDMGERPSRRHSIDRLENDGDYSPGNCRWATPKQQARNRSSNRVITIKGERKTMVEWAEQFGIAPTIVQQRLKSGWSAKRAVTTPVQRPVDPSVGDKFGEWTVVEPSDSRPGGNKAYLCRCCCGNEQVVSSYYLRIGRSTRCKSCAHRGNRNARKVRNVVAGEHFGAWSVVSESPNRKGGLRRVLVRCSCGNTSEVAIYDLLGGKSKRCSSCARRKK